MKKWLIGVCTALVTAVLSTIVTGFLTGQSLAGLVKLRSFSATLLSSSVPAWSFAVVLFCALLGALYFVRHVKPRKGKIHFVPDANNFGWAARGDSPMDVSVCGMFTYDGPGEVMILKAFLKGTAAIGGMIAAVLPSDGSGRPVPVSELCLGNDQSTRAVLNLRLTPVLGVEGQAYRGQLIFRDRYNRDFRLEPVEFPWIGAR